MKAGVIAAVLCAVVAGSAQARLFGVNGTDADCPQKKSRAWCALDARGLSENENKDLSKSTVMAKIDGNDNSKSIETAIDIAAIGATLGGAFTAAPGFTNIGEASMLLVNMFLTAQSVTRGTNFAFGWMPYELASTPEEARRLFYKTLVDATMKTFAGYELEMTTGQLPNDEKASYSVRRDDVLVYRMKGPGCESSQCALVQFRRSGEYAATFFPKEGVAPAWMGGYKAWEFARSGVLTLELWTGKEYASNKYLVSASKELPKWMMISLGAQGKPKATYPADGMFNRGVAINLVLSEGNIWAPIFPEIEFTAPARESGNFRLIETGK